MVGSNLLYIRAKVLYPKVCTQKVCTQPHLLYRRGPRARGQATGDTATQPPAMTRLGAEALPAEVLTHLLQIANELQTTLAAQSSCSLLRGLATAAVERLVSEPNGRLPARALQAFPFATRCMISATSNDTIHLLDTLAALPLRLEELTIKQAGPWTA
jgi:hypothetical protein